MTFPNDQCSKSETTWNRNLKSQAAILNCPIENDVLFFYFKLAWTALRTATEIINAHRFSIILSVILVLFFYVVYKSYWSPVLYVRELTDIGFDHIPKGPDRDIKIAREMRARRLGVKIPPPYPNGWFALVESEALKNGGVTTVNALGQNLCVYRGEDGIARCVDAYCPHLGANLGVGGRVEGGCIECPFHRWRFDADGTCVNVPGLEIAPRGVSIKTWPVVEADGAVWVWHDAEGRSPLWNLKDAEELKTWSCRGRNEFVVGSHIMDIPENGADVAHLNPVHSTSLLSSLAEKYPLLLNFIGKLLATSTRRIDPVGSGRPGMRFLNVIDDLQITGQHTWTAEWKRGEGHEARMDLHHKYRFGKFSVFQMEVAADQIGPGHVRLRLNSVFGPALISQSVTPISPLQQRVIHRFFSPWYNAPAVAVLVHAESKMFERDVAIWNSKRYVSSPAYARIDKSIRAFRLWYSQFYSERSLSFKDATLNPLDW